MVVVVVVVVVFVWVELFLLICRLVCISKLFFYANLAAY